MVLRVSSVVGVSTHSIDLQPVSPMFLDVEVFCHAVKPAIRVATVAMLLDTGSSLSFPLVCVSVFPRAL